MGRGVVALGVAAVAGLCAAAPAGAAQRPQPVAATPPMGWNSWNSFGCDVSEQLIRQMADALVSSGMRDAGYSYVVVDDCWFEPQRTASGELQGSLSRFPSGMKALADYVHSKGLKFGLYEVPTEKTCAQRGGAYPGTTGSLGHEQQDARTFASWGVDYLKYDWCSPDGTLADQIAGFTKMRDALRATGRPIVYSINPNSYHADKTGASHDWSAIANMWRTTEDIKPVWDTGHVNEYPMGVVNIVDVNAPLFERAGPGHWNDPDMLEVGVGAREGFPGLTPVEQQAHLGMWALMAAPLIAGNDVRSASADTDALLTNPRVIAIDQDRLGRQGHRVRADAASEVWVKPLADGDKAVGLFNRSSGSLRISATLKELGVDRPGAHGIQDVWTGSRSSVRDSVSADVPGHGLALYRLSR